jgi:hypothetical protein
VHPELDAALTLVVADLRVPGGVVPVVDDTEWQDHPGAASCWLRSPDGTGAGVWVQTGQPFPAQVLALVEQVQEWAVEALWTLHRPASWPTCPNHPDRHPLAAHADRELAVWSCPVLDETVSAIGSLGSVRSRTRPLRRRT